MRDEPDTVQLLRAARETLADEILPGVPAETRPALQMCLRALAISLARLDAGDLALGEERARLYRLLGIADDGKPAHDLRALNRELVKAIRGGRFDAPGADREALRAHLMETLRSNILESNPKFLEPAATSPKGNP